VTGAALAAAPRRAWVEQVMGIPVSVHVRDGRVAGGAGPDGREVETAVAQAFAHLRRVDRALSTWRADSDLLRVARGELAPGHAHPWLDEVRTLCEEAEHRTGGLFSARLAGGYDPTGLVKGWAVEGAARHLALVPGISFCVNAGGDLLAGAGRGTHPTVWTIGVEDPRDRSRVAATVELAGGGLATSGSAARGAHVLDPRTGRPVTRDGSASVWGPSLLWADVWATALFVDPDGGALALAAGHPAYRCLVL